jgi:hypothetical protein
VIQRVYIESEKGKPEREATRMLIFQAALVGNMTGYVLYIVAGETFWPTSTHSIILLSIEQIDKHFGN